MKALTKVTLGFLFIGIIILAIGGVFYYQYAKSPKTQPMGASGFTFETYPLNNEKMTDFSFVLSVEPRDRTFYVELYFVCYDRGNYQIAMFTPYQISSLEPTYPNLEPNKVEWTSYKSSSGSIIFANFTIENNDTFRHRAFATIRVCDSIVFENYGTYTLDLPFGSYYSADLQQLKNNLSLKVNSGLNISGQLRIFLPTDAILTQKSHDIQSRAFYTENQSMLILMDTLENVFIQYSIPKEVNDFQNMLFWSGIVVGLGTSVIIASSEELVKNNYKAIIIRWKKKVRKKV